MSEVAILEPDVEVLEGAVVEGPDLEGDGSVPGCEDLSPEEQLGEIEAYTARPMIPVEMLTKHPDNVREDAQADTAFCRSVSQLGIITPLEITFEPDRSAFRVVDGNRRLDAALKVGLEKVPYTFNTETVDNEGLQALHMLVTSRYRVGLTIKEEAAALFRASDFGMTQSDIRKATGLKASEVKAGIRAAALTPEHHKVLEKVNYEWTIEDLSVLAQYSDDEELMRGLLSSRNRHNPPPLKYTVQKLLEERKEEARRAELLAELDAAGIQVEYELPRNAVYLTELLNGSERMDPEGHAACPGRGVELSRWSDREPKYFCANPKKHKHVWAATGTINKPKTTRSVPVGQEGTVEEAEPPTPHKIVREGNIAWPAAARVRGEALAEFLKRPSPPKELIRTVAEFVALQYLTMPEPLCKKLDTVKNSQLFGMRNRARATEAGTAVERASLPGLWMIALAPIINAYEQEMSDDHGVRRDTWREEKYSPVGYADAGAYLRFCIAILASQGWEASPIERAVAEQRPYLGDEAEGAASQPANAAEEPSTGVAENAEGQDAPATEDSSEASEEAEDREPAAESPTEAGEADPEGEAGELQDAEPLAVAA